MILRCAAIILIIAALGADPIKTPEPSRPAPPKIPEPGAWDRIQDSLDRSTGRITNEPTYQVERLQRLRDERFNLVPEQKDFQRFQEQHERELRIDQRRQTFETEAQRKAELDRREYLLFLSTGLTSTSLQAKADEQALTDAKGKRDAGLIAAQNARADQVRQRPEDKLRMDEAFEQQTRAIMEQFDHDRARILGVPPTTQPAELPASIRRCVRGMCASIECVIETVNNQRGPLCAPSAICSAQCPSGRPHSPTGGPAPRLLSLQLAR